VIEGEAEGAAGGEVQCETNRSVTYIIFTPKRNWWWDHDDDGDVDGVERKPVANLKARIMSDNNNSNNSNCNNNDVGGWWWRSKWLWTENLQLIIYTKAFLIIQRQPREAMANKLLVWQQQQHSNTATATTKA